jgi:hypothetical protein
MELAVAIAISSSGATRELDTGLRDGLERRSGPTPSPVTPRV